MTRPPARKSSLAGSTPAAPLPAVINEPAIQQPTARPGANKPKKQKVAFYQAPADTARARAAWINTQGKERTRSLSEFIDNAVMEKVEELETKYNQGKSWAAIEAGVLPKGRPVE